MPESAGSPDPVASQAFLHACGLPAAWAGAAQWRVLETDFGDGCNFLATWAAWRADPERPALLHCVAIANAPPDFDAMLSARQRPALRPLAQLLAAQAWGLLPGVHRLGFEDGKLLLTLCVGDAPSLLRKERWRVDTVYASGLTPHQGPAGAKAIARCCERGARLAIPAAHADMRAELLQAGFALDETPTDASGSALLCGVFQPRWEPRRRATASIHPTPVRPARCTVVGAGIAGASVAASLARRGWQVEVLDAGSAPAAGASGLPVGLFAPHLSPDDNLFSKLSRAGVRATLEQGARVLRAGSDWQPCGVLERRSAGNLGLPPLGSTSAGADWSEAAAAARLHAAGLPGDSLACWHPRAGWARPAALVNALLATPGVRLRTHCRIDSLRRVPTPDGGGLWQLHGPDEVLQAQAELVVLATGPACNALLPFLGIHALPLDPVWGQLSWGEQSADLQLPAFPVNGDGALIAQVPTAAGALAWYAGSTFERGRTELRASRAEQLRAHAENFAHLQGLLPAAAQQLAARFAPDTGGLNAWSGVRCTSRDRMPIVGPLAAERWPGLWVSTAMGARGLSRAILCGELLAARLHAEPLPVEERLARAMGTERLKN